MLPIFDSLISTLFPHRCRVCGGHVDSIQLGAACSECWGATRIYTGNETLCPKCGNFLREGRVAGAGRCHRCDTHEYDLAVACGAYEKALSATIVALKRQPFVPPIAQEILCSRFENSGLGDCDIIIPIPLSKRRLKERGFNQAETIAQPIAKRFGARIDTESLLRTSHTPIHRGGMDDKARDMTVRKAFAVVDPEAVHNMHIVLTDDVMTSGATAAHCASELKKKGAASVRVFTLARAL